MTEYENLLAQAYAEYEGQEYRENSRSQWNFTDVPKFSEATVLRHARRGLIPTARYTEHLLGRRGALTDLIDGKEAGGFPEMTEEMLVSLRRERDSIDSTVAMDHMLLAAKVVHRYAPDATAAEVDDMLAMAADKLVRCVAVRDREHAFSTYAWAAIRNAVFRFCDAAESWDTVCMDDDLSESQSRVCLPGQYYLEQVADESPGPADQLQTDEMLAALAKILEFRSDFLSEQEETVLSSWTGVGYGLGGPHRVSQRTIAYEMGLTPQRVQQVLTAALSKVQAKLAQINSGAGDSFFDRFMK